MTMKIKLPNLKIKLNANNPRTLKIQPKQPVKVEYKKRNITA